MSGVAIPVAQVVQCLRDIAANIDTVAEVHPGALFTTVSTDELREWAADLRLCAENLGDDR